MKNDLPIRCPYCQVEMKGQTCFTPLQEDGSRLVSVLYKCPNCHATTPPSGTHPISEIIIAKAEARAAATTRPENITISSHGDREILDACISLIDGVLNGEYGIYSQLADDDFDFEAYKERHDCELGFSYSFFEIVQRLFLWKTNHRGGTSTHAKCAELGVDAGKCVSFGRRLEGDKE